MRLSKGVLYFLVYFIIFGLYSCGSPHNEAQLDEFSRDQINVWNKHLTDVIIADIFTPPVASRIYAYTNIAAYEALVPEHPEFKSYQGQLAGMSNFPQAEQDKNYYFPVSSIIAFSRVGQHLVYNQEAVQEKENAYLEKIREIGIDGKILQNSIEYGEQIAQFVIDWAKKDGYIERQSLPRYTLLDDPGKWVPTPPDYMPGIEPHWSKIRPFVLDSANQFIPPPPTPFDSTENSAFYKECMDVYETVNQLNEDQVEIAKFWDCNPNISFTKGHVMFYHQQISPGGHWIMIASIASRQENLDLMQRAEMFSVTSIALADAFISCWDEKYRSSLIRPETYIYRYIDKDWKPILQTPAFPEYTSGHSVISAAAATALTNLLGDSFAFTDSSEVEYGLPAREYKSFREASQEAAISRLYGGIHYRPAIDNGVEQGNKVGNFVLNSISTRKGLQALKSK
ncbi:MAG: vanadium-dependent haloperoxidase [Candidatus Cyclobacteriaceae bacterium M3_2C_046]